MEQFKPIRCFIVECAVRALGVIEFYISINTSHELALGVILGPIKLMPFHGGKEGLGHSIVMRAAGLPDSEKDWTTLFMRSSFRNVLDVYCGPGSL